MNILGKNAYKYNIPYIAKQLDMNFGQKMRGGSKQE